MTAVALNSQASNATFFSGTASPWTSTKLTIAAGSNLALILLIGYDSTATLGSITWGAQTLTQIGTTTTVGSGTALSVSLWGLIAPNTGNQTLTVPFTGPSSASATFFHLAYQNVDQTGGTTTFYNFNSSSSTSTTTLTNNIVVSSANDASVDGAFSPFLTLASALQSQLNVNSAGTYIIGISDNINNNGTIGFGWTGTGSPDNWVESGVAIKAVAGSNTFPVGEQLITIIY